MFRKFNYFFKNSLKEINKKMMKNFKIDDAESYETNKKSEEKDIAYYEKIINKEYSKIEKWLLLIQNNEFNKTLPNSICNFLCLS